MPDFNPQAIADLSAPLYRQNEQALKDVYSDIIAKATPSPNSVDLSAPPKDFNPKNNYYAGQSVAPYIKPSLETTNYNIDDAYTKLNDGTYVAKYDTYKAGRNNAEYAAQTQTTTDKWLNGLSKFVGQTGTAVLGGTIGIGYGIGQLIEEGSLSSLYDNDFTNTLNRWNTYMQNQLPNYYSKQEQDKGLFGQVGTANFWSDKVLGGLSFTAGAIISESLWAYATGGTSLGTRLARWGSESIGAANVIKGVNAYKSLLKAPLLEAYQAGKITKDTALALGKTGDLLNLTRFAMTSAGYEASVEALQFKNEQKENFYNNFYKQNGYEPTQEDITEFEKNLNDTSNAVFGMNMAIVGSSNLVTLGGIFNLKNPINTGVSEFIEKKLFGKGITSTIGAEGKAVYAPIQATKAQRIAKNIFDYTKNPITEGIYEEGGQGVVSKAAGKWLEYSYNPQKATESVDTSGLIYESLAEQYGTKEGWVENGVGLIVGALGGTVNVRSQRAQQNAEIDYKVAGLNTFTNKAIRERILLSSRQSSFSEEAQSEAQKGNIVASRIATDGVLHSALNHKYQLGENVNDAVKEAAVALDTVTPEQFAKAGVSTENIEDFKKEVITSYQDTANEFLKNRKYAEYVVGQGNIAGAKEVLNSVGDAEIGTNSQEALVQSLTWSLTAGNNAGKLMRDLHSQIQTQVGVQQASAVNTLSQLKKQSSTKRGQITKTVNKVKALSQERDNLQKSLIEVQNAPKEIEGDRANGSKLGQLNIRLIDVENQLTTLNQDLQGYTDEINTQQDYQNNLADINLNANAISTEDILNLDDNLQSLKNVVSSMSQVNPQKYEYLTDLLDEYSQAENIFNTNKASSLAISSGTLKLKNLNSWLSKKLSKGASLDEFTTDWITDILQNYQQNKVNALSSQLELQEVISDEDYNNFVDNNIVSDDILSSLAQKLRTQTPFTERELAIFNSRTQDVENIIKETPVVNEQVIAEVIQPKTPAEILRERLENLLSNNYNSLSYIGTNYDELLLKKPTKAEIEEYRALKDNNTDNERFQLLNEKLGNWRLLDSAVGSENQSIADLIDLLEQLDTVVETENTLDEIPEEEVSNIVSTGVSNNVVRYDLAQNTLGNVTVQLVKNKGIYKFSHLKMASILSNLGVDFTSERVQIAKNGKKVNNKKESDFINYSPGTVFYLDNTSFTIGAGNTIEIKEEDYVTLRDSLNLHIVVPTSNWSYYDVYEKIGDSERKKPSDFTEDINPSLIYNIKPDDELTFQIANDEFNQKLRDRVINSERTPEIEKEVESQLKIYIMYKGQAVSTLKGESLSVSSPSNFKLLRQVAKEAFFKNPLNPQIAGKVKARYVFLGSPEIKTENLRSLNIPITTEAVKNVQATGYYEHDNFTVSREIPDIDKTYVANIKTDKKIPVLIIKRGAYNIAYPISLIKTPSVEAQSIIGIVNDTSLSEIDKVKAINQRIIETGIARDKRLTSYNEEKIQGIIDDFNSNESFISMEDFSNSNYNIERLTSDATINIDLEKLEDVISSPKLEIDLSTIEINLPSQDRYESIIQVENRLNDLATELDNDYKQNAQIKYINTKGEILEDTVYTNAFDEGNLISNPTSQVQKINNVKIIQRAFSEKLPKVVKNVLSQETIDEVEYLLKKYSAYKNQITANQEEAKKSISENSCG